MRYRNIIVTLLASTLLLSAGGKGVAPAKSEVLQILQADPFYVGAAPIIGSFVGTCGTGVNCPYEDVTYGVLIRVGYDWNQYIGLEGRVLSTFWEEDPLGGERLQHIGLYLKPTYPISEDFNIYGLAGYGETHTIVDHPQNDLVEIDESGFSWGIGIEYDFSDRDSDLDDDMHYDREFDGHGNQEKGWGLFLDYQKLLVDSDYPNPPDLEVVSFGITYDF